MVSVSVSGVGAKPALIVVTLELSHPTIVSWIRYDGQVCYDAEHAGAAKEKAFFLERQQASSRAHASLEAKTSGIVEASSFSSASQGKSKRTCGCSFGRRRSRESGSGCESEAQETGR